MDVNEFQRDKEIDPSQLDMECVKQPDRFFHWAQAASLSGALTVGP